MTIVSLPGPPPPRWPIDTIDALAVVLDERPGTARTAAVSQFLIGLQDHDPDTAQRLSQALHARRMQPTTRYILDRGVE